MNIDWKDPNQYAYLQNVVDGTVWAWEFLRRNPLYQQAYLKSLELPSLSDLNSNKDSKEIFRHFDCDPPSQNATTYREYIKEAMATNVRCSVSAKKDEIMDQFSLKSQDSLQPPDSVVPPEFYAIYPEFFPISKRRCKGRMTSLNIEVDKDDVVVAFSPHGNIPLQIETVKNKLNEIKGAKRDGLPSAQTLYFGLRAFDAIAQNATIREASREIFRVKKSQDDIEECIAELTKELKRDLSRATDLVSGGYRSLVGRTLATSIRHYQNKY